MRKKEDSTSTPSYHDLYVTTADMRRTSIFNLPFGITVTCTRTGGWELWRSNGGDCRTWERVAGEYELEDWLVLDVNGTVIVDGRSETTTNPPQGE